MAITSLPTAPSRTRPATFSSEADALLGALPTMVAEFNASMAGESAAALALNISSPASGKGAALQGFGSETSGANRTTAGHLALTLAPQDVSGVDPTGTTDSFSTIYSAFGSRSSLRLYDTTTYLNTFAQDGLAMPSNFSVIGDFQSKLKATTLNWRVLNTEQATTRKENVNYVGVVAENNTSNTDDWAPIRFSGLKKGLMFGNNIAASWFGISVQYSFYNDKTERRSSEIRLIGNVVQASGAGFELFSPLNSVVVGNVAYKDGTLATNHGYRFTGYGRAMTAPGADLRNRGNAAAGNVARNFGNGISIQAGVQAQASAAFSLTDCTNGISIPVYTGSVGETADDMSVGDVLVGVAIDNVSNGLLIERGGKQVMESLAIRNFGLRGIDWRVTSSAGTLGIGKYNRVSGLIADQLSAATGDAVRWEASNSRLDITVADIAIGASRGVRIAGNFNVVTITGGGYQATGSPFLEVGGSNNIVMIAADDIARTFGEIQISGNNNLLICNQSTAGGSTDGRVSVSGNNNTVQGNCNLTGLSGTGNDYTGIVGGRSRGIASATTDASGDLTITHGLNVGHSSTGYIVRATSQGTGSAFCMVHTKNGTSFKVRFANAAGAIASTAVVLEWSAEIFG
jgi:hypothetical protein